MILSWVLTISPPYFCFYKFSKVYVCNRNKVYIFSKF